MSRVLIFVAVVGLAGSIGAAVAAAKGPDHGSLCGAFTCVALPDEPSVRPFIFWWRAPFARRVAPQPARYLQVQLHDRLGTSWLLLYVPERHAMPIWQSAAASQSNSVGPYWRRVPASAAVRLRELTR